MAAARRRGGALRRGAGHAHKHSRPPSRNGAKLQGGRLRRRRAARSPPHRFALRAARSGSAAAHLCADGGRGALRAAVEGASRRSTLAGANCSGHSTRSGQAEVIENGWLSSVDCAHGRWGAGCQDPLRGWAVRIKLAQGTGPRPTPVRYLQCAGYFVGGGRAAAGCRGRPPAPPDGGPRTNVFSCTPGGNRAAAPVPLPRVHVNLDELRPTSYRYLCVAW